MRLVLSLSVLLFASTALANGEAKPAELSKEASAKVRAAINAGGRGVDNCTKNYTTAVPDGAGKATVSMTLDAEGKVTKATVGADVPRGRPLEECLERVAKGLRFPSPPGPGAKLQVVIPVRAGNPPFQLPDPDAPKTAETEKSGGFLTFTPGNFMVDKSE